MDAFQAEPIMAATVGSVVHSNDTPFQANTDINTLPAGFPASFDTEKAWTGSQFSSDNTYIYPLTTSDLGEVSAAVTSFNALGLDGSQVTKDNFRLPLLGKKLQAISRDIHHGRGFCVIRGVDPAQFSVEDLTTVYLGIQAYIADQRARQDCRGNMMVHIVADKTTKTREAHHRHSTDPITFHTEESGDIISWLTRGTAAAGGKCIISSAVTVYNIIAATRPDIIRTLARSDWPFAFPRFQCRPVIFNEGGNLIMNFGRAPLLGSSAHPRKSRLPVLSARQIEALDAIEAVARATELEFSTQPGDIHFINNLSILHRREGFVDGQDTNEKRHLVRMRLRDSVQGWLIPQPLQREWHDAFEKEGDRVWHLEPMPDHFFPLRRHPN